MVDDLSISNKASRNKEVKASVETSGSMFCHNEIFSVSEAKQSQAGYCRCNNESKEEKILDGFS